MTTLFVTVWGDAEEVPLGDPLQEFSVNIAATSTASTETISGSGNKRRHVRLFADTNCFVIWGEDPTAVNDGSDGRPMGSDNPEYFNIQSGHKIAVIERI